MLRKGGCVEKVVEVAPSFEYRFPSVEYRVEIASFGRLSETMKPRVEWRPGRRRFREERFRLTVKALGVFMHAHRDNARVRTGGNLPPPARDQPYIISGGKRLSCGSSACGGGFKRDPR